MMGVSMSTRFKSLIGSIILMAGVSGCQTTDVVGGKNDLAAEPATLQQQTSTASFFESFPAPVQPLDVAVYTFPDQTGKYEPSDDFAQYSRAVSQGSPSILVDVLKSIGRGQWFEVIEREGLAGLLKERELIHQTRVAFQGKNAQLLPALHFAGIIMGGAVVGYDSNITTGGAGAKYLGIGGDVQYRRDIVTVTLRATSVQSGRVLTSVTTSKTVYSVVLRGGAFKFVALNDLLEIEAGYSRNEPEQIALREAIELAVFSTILEGTKNNLWKFQDPNDAQRIIDLYDERYKTKLGSIQGNS